MRIVHVVPDLAPEMGGPVTAAWGMAEALSRAGARVRVLATDHGWPGPDGSRGLDVQVYRCRFCPWRYSPGLAHALRREVQWADLVHVHTMWHFSTLAALRASAGRAPAILRPAGMLDAWSLGQKPWRKRAYLAAFGQRLVGGIAALHWTSREECQASRRFGENRPEFVIPLGLAKGNYENLPEGTAFSRRFPELAGRRLVLFLGRLHPKKQPELVIRAFAGIHSEFQDTALVLAGTGSRAYRQSLHDLVGRLKLGSETSFVGMQYGREVLEALVAASVFVLPSLQENFALAAAEAMAAGCPVVLSPQVALARAVLGRAAGLVVQPDLESLKGALRYILKDPGRARLMGQNGRRLVFEEFTWESVAAGLLAIYEDLLRGTRSSRAWCPATPRSGT